MVMYIVKMHVEGLKNTTFL